MITHHSSSKAKSLVPKTILLDIQGETRQNVIKNRIQSHRIKKMNLPDTPRISKIESVLENIQFTELITEIYANAIRANDSAQAKQTNLSAYLTYKQQQRKFRSKHNNKISFLQNKYLQLRNSPEVKPRDLHSVPLPPNHESMRSKRKMSLIVLGDTINDTNNEDMLSLKKSRDVYIKTSEGRRQKVSTLNYMNKIQEKNHELFVDSPFSNALSISSSLDKNEATTISNSRNVLQQSKPSLLQHIRKRSLKKQAKVAKVNQCDFRPWTSHKSQIIQQ